MDPLYICFTNGYFWEIICPACLLVDICLIMSIIMRIRVYSNNFWGRYICHCNQISWVSFRANRQLKYGWFLKALVELSVLKMDKSGCHDA